MKLIAPEFGQALQLLVMDEIRPLEGVFGPDLIKAMVDRYRFAVVPTDLAVAAASGFKFQTGVIALGARKIPINNLDIYNDGVVVNVKHTDDADAVMSDFIRWATEAFRLRAPQTKIPRKFASHVVVEFAVSLDEYLDAFEEIATLFSSALKKAINKELDMHVARFAIGADPVKGLPAMQTTLTIERRAGLPFEANRYYVTAPLATPVLLELLENIESIF